MSKDLLIVKVDTMMKDEDPCYYSAIVVPEDLNIRVETYDGEILDLE